MSFPGRSALRVGMAVAVLAIAVHAARPAWTARYAKAPEFPTQDPRQWIGPPQSIKALAGRVVLLDVWTFG